MKLVKSDAKGRVPVGYKDAQFKMHKLGGGTVVLEIVIDPLELMSYPAPEPALEYLRSFGIDPMTVSTDGANDAGYDGFELDDQGKPVFEYGLRKRVRKPWPEGFDWTQFVQLAVGVKV